MSNISKHKLWLFIITFCIILFFIFVDLTNGSVNISFKDIYNYFFQNTNNNIDIILTQIRIPRIVTAILSGIALSISGLLMQTLFRNPLAGPYVLGISSGASLGVAISVLGLSALGININNLLGNSSLILFACIGAGVFMLIILLLSLRIKEITTILIVGMLLGSAINALINLFQFTGSEQSLKLFVIWTMGSLSNTNWQQIEIMSFIIFVGICISVLISYSLNIWLLGYESAKTLGLKTSLIRNLIFLATTLLAGSVTAFCGPIAFIGIASPHIARMVSKSSDHRFLVPYSALIGIVLILFADILSQISINNVSLPINSTTAILGIPIVIWVVINNKKIWV